jgi:CheY-like chemotaxis protein
MDGFEMIRHLLGDQAVRPRALIAVSARTWQELATMGTLPDEVLLFTKPLEHKKFLAALQRIVQV